MILLTILIPLCLGISLPSAKNFLVSDGSVTDKSLFLTWEGVPKADSYKLDVMPPTVGVAGVGNGITDRFSRVLGLEPDTEYTFRLMAMKDGMEGIAAVVWARTALPAPDEIFALPETLTSESMQIAWSEVDKAESYIVEVQPSSGVSGAGNAIYKTSTTLRGLTPNTQYTIVVKPSNWVATGGEVVLKQYTRLPSPESARVIENTISHDTVTIQWEPVSGASGYEITFEPEAPDAIGAGSGIRDTLATIRGLKADVQYTIFVAAVNDAGASQPTSVGVKTLSICYAKAEDYLKQEKVTITCPARCSKYQDHVYGTREYTTDSYICAAALHDGRIHDSTGGEVTIKKKVSGLQHYVGTLLNGINSKDYGAWSKSFIFALYAPNELNIVPGSVSDTQVMIEWQLVSGADSYDVAIRTGDAAEYEASSKMPSIRENKVQLSELLPDTTYVISVTARNVIEFSEPAEVRFTTALPPPRDIRVTEVTKDAITLAWEPIPGAEINSYTVTYYKDGVGHTHDLGAGQTQVNIAYLNSGTEYVFEVRAINEVGRGGVARLEQFTKLDSPADLDAEQVGSTTLMLTWDEVDGADYYTIDVTPCCPRVADDSEITIREAWLEDLTPNTKYNFTVFAHNVAEKSPGSNIEVKTALPGPMKFGAQEGSIQHSSLVLEWDTVVGASKYQISVRTLNGEQVNSYAVGGEKTAVNITELTPNTDYVFKLNGINDVGAGAEEKFYTATLASPPMGLIVQADPDYPDRVLVTWQEDEGVTDYRVFAEPGENVVGTGDVTGSSRAVLAGLEVGETYEIFVAAISESKAGSNATVKFTTALPPPAKVWINPETISPFGMQVEWTGVDKASAYEVTYNNLDTKSVKTITGLTDLKTELYDMEPASRYRIYVVSVQEKESFTDEAGEVFTSYTGDPIHGLTQINAPAEVRVIKHGMKNGTVTVMWEGVEKASTYRVGIVPSEGIIGTGTYSNEETETKLYGLDPTKAYKIFVSASNEEFGLTSEKTMSSQLSLAPLSNVNGRGVMGGSNIVLKGSVNQDPLLFDISDFEESSGDGYELKEPVSGISPTWMVVIIVGSVLLFLLLCVIVPCVIECRKCRSEGHCCCCLCAKHDEDFDEVIDPSSLERQRQKAAMAGINEYP